MPMDEFNHIDNWKYKRGYEDGYAACKSKYQNDLKHGEWLWELDVRCSCCGYKLETTGLPSECPACHAKMDGGKE